MPATEIPRFVPTLTEVVGMTSAPAVHAVPAVDAPVAEDLHQQEDFAEQIAHRVLQRIDAALEARLSEAVRAVVARHTEAMLPVLREEIVTTVQAAVAQALVEEFLPSETRPG